MPKLAQKAKALNGKGAVVSYAHEPAKFYYRELIKGTKNYRSQLIEDADTLELALEKCIDTYTELKARENFFGSVGETVINRRPVVVDNSGGRKKRIKTKELSVCVEEFLASEKKRRDANLLGDSTYENKERTLRKWMLPYLKEKGCSHSQHIETETLRDYPVWRQAAKTTRRLELVIIKDFIDNYLRANNLMRDEIDFTRIVPKIKIADSELDANPPLDAANWRKVLVSLKENVTRAEKNPNHRGHYSNRMFYHWAIIARNSGLRPNVELNALRWCDVKAVNVGRDSESEGKRVDKWVSVIYVKKSKTGKQRTVPTNGVHKQLEDWKKEQEEYIKKHCPNVEITNETLIFGNPYNEMRAYSMEYLYSLWRNMLDAMEEPLAPYVFSDKGYTLYSLRSTYICNLIIDSKGIYDVAKLAGHTVAVCEKYYARLDMAVKAEEITEFEYGQKGSRKAEERSY